jgi:hypothetical protein
VVRLLGGPQGRASAATYEAVQGCTAGGCPLGLPSSVCDGAIYEVACWAHARRKFHDIHAVHVSPVTTEAIARVGALYRIQEEVRGKPAEVPHAIRQTRAKSLLDDLRHSLGKSLCSLFAKGETAAAIRYALSRWRALTRYVDDGLLEIDNLAAERALRAVALGRKNYLFAGSDSSANALPPSIRWSTRQNSTVWTLKDISARF